MMHKLKLRAIRPYICFQRFVSKSLSDTSNIVPIPKAPTKKRVTLTSIANMTEELAKQELVKLDVDIKRHDDLYYNQNIQEIP
jgi:hypothetical protein